MPLNRMAETIRAALAQKRPATAGRSRAVMRFSNCPQRSGSHLHSRTDVVRVLMPGLLELIVRRALRRDPREEEAEEEEEPARDDEDVERVGD